MTAEPAGAAPIAFVGFGEAARAIASGWGAARAGSAAAYDVKSADPATAAEIASACREAGVAEASDLASLLAGEPLVFCLVTADQAAHAAAAAAPHLTPGTLWLDGNSSAPGTKKRAAAIIEATGARYVDLAIMAPIHPRLHRTPMLIAGPHAEPAREALAGLDMTVEIAGDKVGDASSIKMIRSVMIKGMEALTAECLLAARRAGVEEAVLRSFERSDPGTDWRNKPVYNFGRMTAHGLRRAAEMREVAATLRELGLPDRMASATALWQEQIGALGLDEPTGDIGAAADQILAALG